MPLGIGSTNSSSLFALNALRVNQLQGQILSAQLSSGNKLISAAIDASGLAISQAMRAQMSGTDQAIYNAQDTVNLTQTADQTLASQTDMLGRMRDLAVRAGNDATLTASDRAIMDQEFQAYNSELTRQGQASNFNTKPLTTDVPGQTYGTQATQVEPNNTPSGSIAVKIDASTAATLGTAGQNLTSGPAALSALTAVDTALQTVSTQRADLGVTQNILGSAVNSLNTSRISLAAANSNIADMNMAEGITQLARLSLLNNTGLAALSATNAQPYGVLKLLGA
jgi:flagellin